MTDREYVTKENVHLFINTNEEMLEGRKPKAIVLEFPGLGGGSCLGGHVDNQKYDGVYARELAYNDILLVYCCIGPWSWMNRGTVKVSDLIVDALLEKYDLPKTTKIAATGGSMGGLGALGWSLYTRQNVVCCAAACPCYDLKSCVFDKPWRPQHVLNAIVSYGDMSFDEGLKSLSMVDHVDEFKNIPYYIVGDGEDECFDLDGMIKFVDKMKNRGLDVDFRPLPHLKHGEFTTEARGDLTKFVIANLTK